MGSPAGKTIEVAAGPLRTLVDALDRGRPLFWTGEVLVEVDADPPRIGQATMVLDADDMAQLRTAVGERTCRECGCTDNNACVFPSTTHDEATPAGRPTTCHWIEDDLCSACDPDAPEDVAHLWQHPSNRAAA